MTKSIVETAVTAVVSQEATLLASNCLQAVSALFKSCAGCLARSVAMKDGHSHYLYHHRSSDGHSGGGAQDSAAALSSSSSSIDVTDAFVLKSDLSSTKEMMETTVLRVCNKRPEAHHQAIDSQRYLDAVVNAMQPVVNAVNLLLVPEAALATLAADLVKASAGSMHMDDCHAFIRLRPDFHPRMLAAVVEDADDRDGQG